MQPTIPHRNDRVLRSHGECTRKVDGIGTPECTVRREPTRLALDLS